MDRKFATASGLQYSLDRCWMSWFSKPASLMLTSKVSSLGKIWKPSNRIGVRVDNFKNRKLCTIGRFSMHSKSVFELLRGCMPIMLSTRSCEYSHVSELFSENDSLSSCGRSAISVLSRVYLWSRVNATLHISLNFVGISSASIKWRDGHTICVKKLRGQAVRFDSSCSSLWSEGLPLCGKQRRSCFTCRLRSGRVNSVRRKNAMRA
jgi:hypothetical protein